MTRFSMLLLLAAGITGCIIPPQGGAGSTPPPGYAGNTGGGAPAASGGGYEAQPAAASGGAEAAAPEAAAPQVVSIDLHNDCPNDVKLFIGNDPKFGSGTHTSLESNSTTSFQMKPGDMIWIEDDNENGISSMSASPGQTSMRILPSCSGFGPN